MEQKHWQDGDIEIARVMTDDHFEDQWAVAIVYWRTYPDIGGSPQRVTMAIGPFHSEELAGKIALGISTMKKDAADILVDPNILTKDESDYLRVYLPQLCRAIGEWNTGGEAATNYPNSTLFITYRERYVRPRVDQSFSEEQITVEAIRTIAQSSIQRVGASE